MVLLGRYPISVYHFAMVIIWSYSRFEFNQAHEKYDKATHYISSYLAYFVDWVRPLHVYKNVEGSSYSRKSRQGNEFPWKM